MAYADFTMEELQDDFGLTVAREDLHASVPELDLPGGLGALLTRNLPLVLDLANEKARSEMLISPILVELKFLHRARVSYFTGIDFNVDEAAGLKGRCDYLFTRDPVQISVTAPVCVIVEAKAESIVGGIPQCLAELVAAWRFNERRSLTISPLHGVVTSGTQWRFLQLAGSRATIDTTEYPIEHVRKIFGILTRIVLGPDPA